MFQDIYVTICFLVFLSALVFILIFQQVSTFKEPVLNLLGTASGIFLSIATAALAVATIILAMNSKAQIEESRLEFETNQRPWVYADVGPPAGPLSFDQNGATLTLNVGLHNSGNTPAISVFPQGALIFDEPENSFLPSARANTQRRRCTALIGTSSGTEIALFPKENWSQGKWGAYAKREEIERMKGRQQATFEKNLPHLLFCIDYQFTYTKDHHITATLFELTSETPITSYSTNPGDPPIPVKATLIGTYAN
jgi:hypothetical protein